MMEVDYRGLEALQAVQEMQSFELAAAKLCITQPAISQRIKALETYYEEPVLVRIQPYRLTPLGKKLMAHFKQVRLLESGLLEQIGGGSAPLEVSIALNRDSLETWFLDLIEEKVLFEKVKLAIISDDQELTLNYFKEGQVSACLSTYEKPVWGGNCDFLGYMDYTLVSSAKFKALYLKGKNLTKALRESIGIRFDKNDCLHGRYLEKFFGLNAEDLSSHLVPSVHVFKAFALQSLGYALMPKIDIKKELKSKKLIELCPDKVWKVPLYWHYWKTSSTQYQKFNAHIIKSIQKKLHP